MPRPTAVKPSILGLQGNRLLKGVPASALEALGAQCKWRSYRTGQRVISRTDANQDVYLIVSGKVRVIAYSAAGRQVTYRDIPGGDWFGDFAAIDGLPRSADIVALENTFLATIGPAAFRALLHDHPAVCDRVLKRLVTLTRELTERVFEFSTLGVQNRVHAELLRLARQAGVAENTARLDPAPRHADIAGQISTYREQVTRELSAMAKQGLIQRAGTVLVILDVARLEKLVAEVRRST